MLIGGTGVIFIGSAWFVVGGAYAINGEQASEIFGGMRTLRGSIGRGVDTSLP
jgi:hypothetical protein